MAAPQQSEPHYPLSMDKADHFILVSLSTKVRQVIGQAMCSAKKLHVSPSICYR